jgi:hypothetical protein
MEVKKPYQWRIRRHWSSSLGHPISWLSSEGNVKDDQSSALTCYF